MTELERIQKEFLDKFSKISSKDELQNLKSAFFGKSGLISLQFKKISTLNENEKKNFAKDLNKIKNNLSNKIDEKFKEIENLIINEKLKDEKIDITLPIRSQQKGKIQFL